ncbi:MAG: hypothetical protein ACOYXB_04065 [Bacteroidota bacterium]
MNRILIKIFLLAGFSTLVQAQDFEVAPVLVSFDANPGESQVKMLTLKNHSSERQKFLLNLSDYLLDEDGVKQPMEAGSTKYSLSDWLTVNPAFVELNPNEEAEITLIMNVPRTGYDTRWGMIQVEITREQVSSEADKQLTTGVVIVPRIVVLVKQSPMSNMNYRGTVSGLHEVTEKGADMRTFEALITNNGDKILDAKAFLAVANLETAEEQQFKPATFTVYPGFKRKVALTLPVKLSPGQYALAFLMDYGHGAPIEGAQMMLEVR